MFRLFLSWRTANLHKVFRHNSLVLLMNSSTDSHGDLLSVYLSQLKRLRFALKRRTGCIDLTEDALQETWIRLSGMKNAPVSIRDSRAFILRVAGNIAVDLLRRERRHSSRCISDYEQMLSVADTSPSPETRVIDRQQLYRLADALMQLPEKPRAALLLSRYDGLSYAQIAAELGVSQSMVAKYLAQALRHCRDALREH